MKYLNPTKLSTSNLLGAAMAAASLTVTAASFTYNATLSYQDALDRVALKKSSFGNEYTPKFDGLRFIETLITAHR